MELNEISGRIIAAAMKVHTAIGPGVLESVYQTCLLHELKKAGLAVQAQAALPVIYDGLHMDSGYRIDLLVENTVIVELKCVDCFSNEHMAQCLNYLKASRLRLALLINFQKPKVEWKRIIYG